jgi:hypothetical protein
MEISTSVGVKNTNLEHSNNERRDVNDWVIRPYGPEDADAWKAFLRDSNNGTLFHDLEFLAYHPRGKYDFRHLVALRGTTSKPSYLEPYRQTASLSPWPARQSAGRR